MKSVQHKCLKARWSSTDFKVTFILNKSCQHIFRFLFATKKARMLLFLKMKCRVPKILMKLPLCQMRCHILWLYSGYTDFQSPAWIFSPPSKQVYPLSLSQLSILLLHTTTSSFPKFYKYKALSTQILNTFHKVMMSAVKVVAIIHWQKCLHQCAQHTALWTKALSG